MDEYIKRKDAFEILQSRLDSISQMSYLNMDWHELDIMRNAIENAIDDVGEVPAADVQPIKRGQWECVGHDDTTYWYRCSVCGHEEHDNMTKHDKYCGSCGARMDGEAEWVDMNIQGN